jgi:hypothetical protein
LDPNAFPGLGFCLDYEALGPDEPWLCLASSPDFALPYNLNILFGATDWEWRLSPSVPIASTSPAGRIGLVRPRGLRCSLSDLVPSNLACGFVAGCRSVSLFDNS